MIDSYELQCWQAGMAVPVAVETIPMTAILHFTPAPPVNAVNPTVAVWDDPDAPGQVCIYNLSANSPLLQLPDGNYEAVLVAINEAGRTESARFPFTRNMLAPPQNPTGFYLA